MHRFRIASVCCRIRARSCTCNNRKALPTHAMRTYVYGYTGSGMHLLARGRVCLPAPLNMVWSRSCAFLRRLACFRSCLCKKLTLACHHSNMDTRLMNWVNSLGQSRVIATPSAIPNENLLFGHSLFALLDGVLKLNLSNMLKPPIILAFGNENIGKSTLLNRIMGQDLLPTSHDICTKMPINIKTRWNSISSLVTIEVHKNNQVIKSVSIKNEQNMAGIVSVEMEKALKDNNIDGISTQLELFIELAGPDLHNLDIVDLPGIPLTGDRAIPAKAVTKTKIAKHPDALFLAVSDSNRPIGDSAALNIIVEMDLKERAIGCITKCDHVFGEIFDEKVIKMVDPSRMEELESHLRLGHGYFAVMLDTNKGGDDWFSDCGQPELDALLQTPGTKKRLGVGSLTVELDKKYKHYLVKEWIPKTIVFIDKQCEKEKRTFWSYGSPIQDYAEFQEMHDEKHGMQILSEPMLRKKTCEDFFQNFDHAIEFGKVQNDALRAFCKTRDEICKVQSEMKSSPTSYEDFEMYVCCPISKGQVSDQMLVPALQDYFDMVTKTGYGVIKTWVMAVEQQAPQWSAIQINRFQNFFSKALDVTRNRLTKSLEHYLGKPLKTRLLQDQSVYKWTSLAERFRNDERFFVDALLMSVCAVMKSMGPADFDGIDLKETYHGERIQICKSLKDYRQAKKRLDDFLKVEKIPTPSSSDDVTCLADRKKSRVDGGD